MSAENADPAGLNLPGHVSSLAKRVVKVALRCLSSASKTQDAAAALLVRLANRPDMQAASLADSLSAKMTQSLQSSQSGTSSTVHDRLGPLRVLAGITVSVDLSNLVPHIYHVAAKLADVETSSISNAVAKKMTVKIMRNIAVVAVRSSSAKIQILDSFDGVSVLEEVIDYLLRSIGDRDTPVRYAAAKAISIIIQELDADMGHEVLQAVLDTFKEDMPTDGDALDFRTADALKWHGLTLTLAHALFKRTASPGQIPDIVRALSSALQFEQRTATGSSMGTNVRDAANFGIWALSRRYTTEELLAVDMNAIDKSSTSHDGQSVIQHLAIGLILSACTDPAGNIRRGSSAALQELVGRHPNQVHEGISLVQIVDYQAVSLRRRAMVDVTHGTAVLHETYWTSLSDAILGWRGIGSTDVSSREAAAASLAGLHKTQLVTITRSLPSTVVSAINSRSAHDTEILHGLSLSLAHMLEMSHRKSSTAVPNTRSVEDIVTAWQSLEFLQRTIKDFSSRTVRSELPAAVAQLLAALCETTLSIKDSVTLESIPWKAVETITEHLLSRFEVTILEVIPSLVKALFALKEKTSVPLGCIAAQTLCRQVASDASRSTMQGAGRAIASGALVCSYIHNAHDDALAVVRNLSNLIYAPNVERRVVGVRALTLVVEGFPGTLTMDASIFELISQAAHRGLNDYTIDERGDVGSLVRLQGITYATRIISATFIEHSQEAIKVLRCDMRRLSLEKLDRVRLYAAQCIDHFPGRGDKVLDVASVSSIEYFRSVLEPLRASECDTSIEQALLEGCMSCAGVGAETLLQASRHALTELIETLDDPRLLNLMTTYSAVLKSSLTASNINTTYPALELLGFLLDMHLPQRLATNPSFKWRNLLSSVQKSHHKSNDIPKILAAVRIYHGLAEVDAIRNEVMRKLIGMLKTNPYPRVRVAVAEVLWSVTGEEMLKDENWAVKAGGERSLEQLQASSRRWLSMGQAKAIKTFYRDFGRWNAPWVIEFEKNHSLTWNLRPPPNFDEREAGFLSLLQDEGDVGARAGQRGVVVSETEEQLGDVVPPVASDPAAKLGVRRAGGVLPLEAVGVDEEAARVHVLGVAGAGVDADGLPRGRLVRGHEVELGGCGGILGGERGVGQTGTGVVTLDVEAVEVLLAGLVRLDLALEVELLVGAGRGDGGGGGGHEAEDGGQLHFWESREVDSCVICPKRLCFGMDDGDVLGYCLMKVEDLGTGRGGGLVLYCHDGTWRWKA
nr:tubulin-specific chaperone d [Quercus suber]